MRWLAISLCLLFAGCAAEFNVDQGRMPETVAASCPVVDTSRYTLALLAVCNAGCHEVSEELRATACAALGIESTHHHGYED